MKTVDFSVVEASLHLKEYALSMVELTGQFPVRDGKKTLEYAFKKQNPSKISVPVELLKQMQFRQDETTGKNYLVIDGNIVEKVTEKGFKRIQLCEKYRPAADTKTSGASVE